MSAKLVLDLTEIRAGLRQLASSVSGSGEAGHIVEAHGNRAVAAIKAGYPSRRGDLQRALSVTHTRTAHGARAVVKNTSKEALYFEYGSQVRHYVTRHGVTHVTGAMPANPIFSQTLQRERRGMYADFRELLTRLGLQVSGDAR